MRHSKALATGRVLNHAFDYHVPELGEFDKVPVLSYHLVTLKL